MTTKQKCDALFDRLLIEEIEFLKQYDLEPILRKLLSLDEIKMFEKISKKGAVNKGRHDKSKHVIYQIESFIYSRL